MKDNKKAFILVQKPNIKAIAEKNGDKLLKIFASTKNVRKEIVKAGQDVESPDFGRKKN